jgi:hypothetical protein
MEQSDDSKDRLQPGEKESKASDEFPEKKSHVLLTHRDLALLTSLHDHVVLSLRQIEEQFFPERDRSTVMNRLKRLESCGFLSRIRVPRLKIYGDERSAGVVFQLSNGGRKELQKHRPEKLVYEKCPAINVFQLDHDLLLADLAAHFERQYVGAKWINGRYLADADRLPKIPDAILKLANKTQVVAIELELTAKSHERYQEIIRSLKVSPLLEKVIFVTGSTVIGRKIMSAIQGYQVPEGFEFKSDLFEFQRLDQCLKLPSKHYENAGV